MRKIGVYIGEKSAHYGGNARANVFGRETREVGHRLVDGLDAVANGEFVHDFLGRLVKVDFPRVVLERSGKNEEEEARVYKYSFLAENFI